MNISEDEFKQIVLAANREGLAGKEIEDVTYIPTTSAAQTEGSYGFEYKMNRTASDG